ncbi:MAG: DUF309 domain-containing protein [Thermodesulfobacteriota bacterium]
MPAFDPFNDRLARDIRNELSTAFIAGLHAGSLSGVEELAAAHTGRGDVYDGYIADRLRRYRLVLAASDPGHGEPLELFCRLWNGGLFFETHELLEEMWHTAAGSRKRALQALIRAAGCYIHLEQNHLKAAMSMAAKARRGLLDNRTALPPWFETQALLDCLRQPQTTPPQLPCRREEHR